MAVLIDPSIEKILQETIFPDLLKGRKDFDLPHTKAVVYWMKQLLTFTPEIGLDSQVMITAAYAHDWGYIGLFEGVDSNDPKVIAARKPLHMERGAELIRKLIDDQLLSFFTLEQKEQVAHLVSMHDKVEELQTDAEILIMEADTLGMLDTDLVKPTFSKEDNDRFISKEVKQRRVPRFQHEIAKNLVEELINKREKFYLSGPKP